MAFGRLRAREIFNAVKEARAAQIVAGQEREQSPRSLRRSAFARHKTIFVVAGAGFAPAAIAILTTRG